MSASQKEDRCLISDVGVRGPRGVSKDLPQWHQILVVRPPPSPELGVSPAWTSANITGWEPSCLSPGVTWGLASVPHVLRDLHSRSFPCPVFTPSYGMASAVLTCLHVFRRERWASSPVSATIVTLEAVGHEMPLSTLCLCVALLGLDVWFLLYLV